MFNNQIVVFIVIIIALSVMVIFPFFKKH